MYDKSDDKLKLVISNHKHAVVLDRLHVGIVLRCLINLDSVQGIHVPIPNFFGKLTFITPTKY
jgi:hypothetical protein